MSDTSIEQVQHDALASTEFVDAMNTEPEPETKIDGDGLPEDNVDVDMYDKFVEENDDKSADAEPEPADVPPPDNKVSNEIPDLDIDGSKTKKQLIADVKMLYKALPGGKIPKNLSNRKKEDLVQLLVAGMDEASRHVGAPPQERTVIGVDGKVVKKQPTTVSDAKCKSAAGTLLKLNSLFGELCDGISRGPYNKTGIVLDGYGQKVMENSDILLPAYAELYRRHHQTLNTYMGSYQIIAACNLTIAASCAKQAEKKD